MEYVYNKQRALNELKEELGIDLFNTFPEEAKDKLIEKQRQLLHKDWMAENLRKADERTRKAKEMGRQMKSLMSTERIGQNFMPPYKRYKSVSVGIEESCEFNYVESRPIVHEGARIYGFRKKTILGFKDRIVEAVEEAESYINVSRTYLSYMYFKLYNNGKVVGSTRSVGVYPYSFEENVDELFSEYIKLIKSINDCVYGYESLFSKDARTYTTFYMTALYFPSPKSILFWGNNIPGIIDCGIFKIFTANDMNEDCIKQCTKFIWGEDASKKINCLNDVFEYANGNICLVYPQSYINNIKNIISYSDLRVRTDSPIKSINVINPSNKYLIIFKEHLGVMFDLKHQTRNIRITSFNPLTKFASTEKITVCFDIEAYFDPEDKNDSKQINIPYLCCACFVYDDKLGNVIEFEGRDCVSQMIEYIVDTCGELDKNKVELVAHNGGAYDFHYILSSMHDPSCIKNIIIRNNKFISFTFKHDNIEFYIKDSYNFLLCSLSNAAKAFLTDDKDFNCKTDFPHHEVRTYDDLNRVYKRWKSIDQITNVEIEKEKLIVSSHHVINYYNNNKKIESKKLIEWSKEYCCNDVIVLAKVWIAFKRAVKEIFNSELVDQSLTLAAMSFKLFEANLEPGIKLYHPNKENYMNMRQSLIGGRCISSNGIYSNVLCLDVKSLYPAAMAYYDQPYGQFRRVKSRQKHELGIYYVKVKTNLNAKTNFFPIRYNNKITYQNICESIEYTGWYSSVDLDIGLEEGHKIEYLSFDICGNVGYSWKNKAKIFKKYIENVLYKLKLKYERDNNKVKRQVIKIIMNSLWGKFAQKWLDTDYVIKSDSEIDFKNEEAYKIWDTDFMLIKNHKELIYSSKPIQNGIFTLSWARWHMKMLWNASTNGRVKCLYSDTDSILIKEEDFNINSKFVLNNELIPVIGENIGQLELECVLNKLLCAGKKQYMGYYTYLDSEGNAHIKEKKRFKGIPSQYIIPDLYIHLLKNTSNIAKIKFLKFRREWGSIKGYIEHKNVKAT